MKRYIALLRGLNISEKNKIPMSELKEAFLELNFAEVTAYLNSENVVFPSSIEDMRFLSGKIKLIIKNRFDLNIPVFIILQKKLAEILSNSPEWWGNDNKEIYDNLIFPIPLIL